MLSQINWIIGHVQPCSRDRLRGAGRLVFVCLGNINRSAFADSVGRHLGLPCISVGLSTTTGAPASLQACLQAQHMGYSLALHRATNLTDYHYREGDLLLLMEERHARRLVKQGFPRASLALLGQWARPQRLHLHDPDTLSSTYFATCFTLIESAVRTLAYERDH